MLEELPDDVQAALESYRKEVEKAYEAEFAVEDSKLTAAKTTTRDQLAELAATAITTMREIMEMSESDATRAKVAMYVTDKVLGKDAVLDKEDPTVELVKRLTIEVDADAE